MQPSHLLVSLFALLSSASGASVGTVYFQVACYHHPSRFDRWGDRCDLTSDCDPEFTFCFSNVHPTASKCGLKRFRYDFDNKNYLGVCNKYEPTNFPRFEKFDVSLDDFKLFLTVTIMEKKKFLKNKLIDELQFQLLPGLPVIPNERNFSEDAMGALNVATRVVTSPDRPRLELRAALRCAPHRFGPRCSVECRPSPRHDCRPDGSWRCRPSWLGPRCEKRDFCFAQPCRPWAKCINRPTGFACACDGREGPQCERQGDPCFDHRCANGATCVAGAGRPHCRCPAGWLGQLCDWRDPCRLGPCGGRGNCSARVDNATTGGSRTADFECDCNLGFTGLMCQNSTAFETTAPSTTLSSSTALTTPGSAPIVAEGGTTIAVIILISLIVTICLVAGVVLIYRRIKKRTQKLTISRRREPIYRVAHHVQSSVYDDPESLYEDPDLNNPLYMYEDPGEVYTEEPDPEPDPEPSPAVPERVVSTSSSKGPRSPIRFVRA